MYKDPYNDAVVAKQQANVRKHATRIDQLNGSGKNQKLTGGVICPMHIDPVTDPKTGKTYQNDCVMAAAQAKSKSGRGKSFFHRLFGDGSACCAKCAKCKCRGMGMSGGGPATPISAKKWFKAEDDALARSVAQTLTPESVRESRMKQDLGAGKSRGGSIMNPASSDYGNVTPQGLTDPQTARLRMRKDLGAGKRGGAKEEEYSEEDELVGGAAEYDDDDDEDYEDGDDCGELEGGGADDGEEPETLRELKSICDDYEQKKLTGGAMTKRVRAMLPHGKKGMSVALSKALQKLKKRGRASFARRVKMGAMVPQLQNMKHSEGNGRYVGGAKDYSEVQSIHDSIFGGSKLTGGYGPVAPTTEALAGYDNRAQPKGLKPPPSVNQQPGMRGGALPLHQDNRGGALRTMELKPYEIERHRAMKGGVFVSPLVGLPEKLSKSLAGSRVRGGRPLIPVSQLPSKIGGGKGGAKGCGEFAASGDYIGPSTGAIIPNLQSEVSPAGSGKRSSRGAMVAKLMKEKGMSLGEASKALKGGRYTPNDFFQPKSANQFFGIGGRYTANDFFHPKDVHQFVYGS